LIDKQHKEQEKSKIQFLKKEQQHFKR